MMYPTRFANKLSRMTNRFLQHTCTTTILVQDGEDDEGHPIYEEEETENVRCLLLWQDVATTDERGNIIVKTPKLYFAQDEPLIADRTVYNVRQTDGIIILKSAKIGTIDTTSEMGNSVLKVCVLEGAQVS